MPVKSMIGKTDFKPRKCHIRCPECGVSRRISTKELQLRKTSISGTQSVVFPQGSICEHEFMVYIDNNGSVRGTLLITSIIQPADIRKEFDKLWRQKTMLKTLTEFDEINICSRNLFIKLLLTYFLQGTVVYVIRHLGSTAIHDLFRFLSSVLPIEYQNKSSCQPYSEVLDELQYISGENIDNEGQVMSEEYYHYNSFSEWHLVIEYVNNGWMLIRGPRVAEIEDIFEKMIKTLAEDSIEKLGQILHGLEDLSQQIARYRIDRKKRKIKQLIKSHPLCKILEFSGMYPEQILSLFEYKFAFIRSHFKINALELSHLPSIYSEYCVWFRNQEFEKTKALKEEKVIVDRGKSIY